MGKKVTFVCKHLANGGAERVMSELITEFVRQGHDVQLILLYKEDGYETTIEYDIPDEVTITQLKWRPRRRVIQAIVHNRELRKVIKGDHIISMLYPATEAAILAGRILHIPVIVSERNNPRLSPPTKVGRAIRNFSFHFADTCVFQTNEAMDFFPASIRKKGVVIPNPIRKELPVRYTGEREKRIAVVGRLEKQKNHPMMLRAFKRFLEFYPEFELHIFSRGPLLDYLEGYAVQLGIQDKVFFEGFVPNVNERIRSYAMYVSTSDYEGISNAMLEALAMGMPTICTDCPVGGARDVIQNDENGILIPVGEEQKLLDAMMRIVNEQEFANRISINATNVRDKYECSRIALQWLNLMH